MKLHEDFSGKEEAVGPSDRAFSLALSAGLAAMGLWPLVWGRPVRAAALGASAAALAAGLARPSLMAPVRRIATRILLGALAVVSAITATLVFYFVVTPTGLLMRLRGWDSLGLRFDPGAASYWKRRDPPGPAPETMSHQY